MSPIDKLNNTWSPAGDTVGSLEEEEVSHWGLALWPGNQVSLPVCFPFPECGCTFSSHPVPSLPEAMPASPGCPGGFWLLPFLTLMLDGSLIAVLAKTSIFLNELSRQTCQQRSLTKGGA